MEKLASSSSGSASQHKIFIGGLSRCPKEGEVALREHFQHFGEIKHILIKPGFAFIEFMDEESVNKSINSPQIHILGGRQVDVQRALETTGLAEDRKIFVGGISKNFTKEDIVEYFKNFGTLVTVKLISNLSENGEEPNNIIDQFAFVLFAHESEALAALQNKYHVIKDDEPQIKVRAGRKKISWSNVSSNPRYSYGNNRNNYGSNYSYETIYPSPSQLVHYFEHPPYNMDYNPSPSSSGAPTTYGYPMSTRYDQSAEDRDSAFVRRQDSSANQQRQQIHNIPCNNPYAGLGLQQQQQSSSNYANYGRNPLALGEYGLGTDYLSSYTSGYGRSGTEFYTGTGSRTFTNSNRHSATRSRRCRQRQ